MCDHEFHTYELSEKGFHKYEDIYKVKPGLGSLIPYSDL